MNFYIKIFLIVVAALVSVLIGNNLYYKNQQKGYVSAAYLSEGLSVATEIKMRISLYYQMNDTFPSSNKDLELPPHDKYVGQSLISLRVSEGGDITLTYNEKSGVNNGELQLIPSIDSAMGIKWKCITPSYEYITMYMPMCEYVK